MILRKTGNVEVKFEDATFIVRVLNAEEEAIISDKLFGVKGGSGEITLSMASTSLAICMEALVGWSTVKDENGKDVPFSKDKIKLLPSDAISKISNAAKGNKISEEEEKK